MAATIKDTIFILKTNLIKMLLKLFIGQIDTKLLKAAMYKEQLIINKISINYHYRQGNKIS